MKTSNNKKINLSKKKYKEILKLKKEKYFDYNIIHFQEKLEEKHKIKIKYWTLRNILIFEKIHKVRKKKEPRQFEKRERKELEWEMSQYDGSYHKWFEERNGWEEVCLLAKIDDATWKVNAKFDLSEWIIPTFNFWKEDILQYWKPHIIYLDKFATYKINHPNATDDKELPTQFWRACKKLGIKLIFANSPQAKWRVERLNKTFQDRLVKELREANISTIPKANKFLQEVFLPWYNNKFSIKAKQKWKIYIKLSKEERKHLDQIFSIHHTRKLKNDFTIAFKNNHYQLYRSKNWWWVMIYKWDTITVEEHLDWKILFSKNWRYIISKKLEEKRKKLYSLPLAPTSNNDFEKMKIELENFKKISKNIESKKSKEKKEFQDKTYFETHKKTHPWMKNFKFAKKDKIIT